MKVTLDLDQLLDEQRITPEEYQRLRELGARGTGRLAFNVLVAFGVIAVSGATLALAPSPITAMIIGLLVGGTGLALQYLQDQRWTLLAVVSVVIGALLFGGGLVAMARGGPGAFLLVTLVYAGAGIMAQSSLLVVLSVLSLAAAMGAFTGYFHAAYYIGIPDPTLTVLAFSLLGVALRWLTPRVALSFRRLASAALMACVFVANFGFWVGSLFGDRFMDGQMTIAPWIFSVAWALVLIALVIWAWSRNQRAVLNTAVVFGAIHFYTQWFETLGASPASILIAGMLALGLALGLHQINRRLQSER